VQLLAYIACNCKRALVRLICLDKCSGNSRPVRVNRPYKGYLTIASSEVGESDGK
jgi:hypothetical protein